MKEEASINYRFNKLANEVFSLYKDPSTTGDLSFAMLLCSVSLKKDRNKDLNQAPFFNLL
jgi:hypothetical protein